jgi:DNA-binding CsgD family transcriptional regulator
MLTAAALTLPVAFIGLRSSALCAILPLVSSVLFICRSALTGADRSLQDPQALFPQKADGASSSMHRGEGLEVGAGADYPWKLVLGLSLYGLAFGLFRLSTSAESLDSYTSNYMLHIASQVAAALIALAVVCWLRRGYWFLSTIGLASFLSGLAISLTNTALLGGLRVFFINFGVTCIDLLTWILLFEFFWETRLAWGRVFGLIRGITLLASFAGAAFAFFWASALDESVQKAVTITLMAAMVVIFSSLFGVRDIASLWGYPKRGIRETPNNSGKRTLFLSRSYGLTTRESEIAVLLMRGRSEPFISETLFISPHTVHSHINHIYAKMKVHSRQEFLDICESELENYRKGRA